jgi:hypothetical protein
LSLEQLRRRPPVPRYFAAQRNVRLRRACHLPEPADLDDDGIAAAHTHDDVLLTYAVVDDAAVVHRLGPAHDLPHHAAHLVLRERPAAAALSLSQNLAQARVDVLREEAVPVVAGFPADGVEADEGRVATTCRHMKHASRSTWRLNMTAT